MNTEKLKRFLTGLVVGLGIAALILSANATRPEVSKHMFHMILFILAVVLCFWLFVNLHVFNGTEQYYTY